MGKTLFDAAAKTLDKKKALMLLGHRGSIEALRPASYNGYGNGAGYRILKRFVKESPAELKGWGDMAFEKCKTFLATELSEDEKFGVNIVRSKVGRNQPCPCGSGKKYKRCCGVVT